jgi:hypothetical protein
VGCLKVYHLSGVYHFCKWLQERHKGTPGPLLLIDEYDAFLKIGRKDSRLLVEMNNLISYNRNTQGTFFSSIVCAGTFSIVATQSEDARDMDIDDNDFKKLVSDDGLDVIVRPFDFVSPWNKSFFIETQPFERQLFKGFAISVSQSSNTIIESEVIDDILETTCGHPGFSIWMLIKAIQQAIGRKSLTTADWINSKRRMYNMELCNTPTMLKMMSRVKSSRKIAGVLRCLVRDNQVEFSDVRLVSFLRAVGIAKPSYNPNVISFTCPIIRDCLLKKVILPSTKLLLFLIQLL